MNIYLNEAGKMDSTTYDGDGAEENKVYNRNLSLIFDSYNHTNKEPVEFMTFLDSINQVMRADIENLKDPDQEFVTMLHNNIAYNQMYSWRNYAGQKFDLTKEELPDNLSAYSSQFDQLIVFDNAELLNSDFYKYMLDDHFRDIVRDSIEFDELLESNNGDREKTSKDYNIATMNMMLDLADSIIPNQAIKSYIYFNAFDNALLRNIDLRLIETVKQNFADRFQEVVTDTSMTNYIANIIDRLEKLSPGMPAPDFSYPDTDGNLVSLSEFRGRYVYLDVWATWCVPCIREIPKLKELEEEFGDKIVFISLSIDTEKEKWYKHVRENELTGIQILSQGGGKAEIMNVYMIQAIPRFIMVDPDGKIIDVDASRPSDDKTKQIFEELTGSMVDDTELI
jgi:thiol-disulfide isomerase/thioredoxin